MRKFLMAILVISFVVISPVLLAGNVESAREMDRSAAGRIGQAFIWPSSSNAANPDEAYSIISAAAEQSGVNVIRPVDDFASPDRTKTTYYIMMGTSESALFDTLHLRRGRFPSAAETRTRGVGISSADLEGSTGVIDTVGTSYEISIEPLRNSFEHYPVAGVYYIEGRTSAGRTNFSELVFAALRRSGVDLSLSDLSPDEEAPTSSVLPTYRLILISGIVLISSVLALSTALSEARAIGVLRLFGFSIVRIWSCRIGIVLAFGTVCALLTTLLFGLDFRASGERVIAPTIIALVGVAGIDAIVAALGITAKVRHEKPVHILKNGD